MAYAKLPRTGPRLNLINSVSTIEESNVLIIFYGILRARVGIVPGHVCVQLTLSW